MSKRSPRPFSGFVAAALLSSILALGTADPADADVVTALADLRADLDRRIAELEPDPAQRKVVKSLRIASAALAVSKGVLSKDAKSAGLAIVEIERSAPGDGLLSPAMQKAVDEFHFGIAAEQMTLQNFVTALPTGRKRTRAEKASIRAAGIFAEFGAAPTQSARMKVLRRSAAAVEKGYRLGGAKKGTFVVAVVGETAFASFAPTATVGDSGDLQAPHAFAIAARAGPETKTHRLLDVQVDLPFLGPGTGFLADDDVARISFCPGGTAPCTEFATDAMHMGSVMVQQLDTGYRIASGTFNFLASDGLGGTTSVVLGAFRVRYE